MSAKKIIGILIIIALFLMCCGVAFASNTESLDDSNLYFGINEDIDDIGDIDDSDLDDDEDWDDDSDLDDDEDWDDDSDLGDDEDWDVDAEYPDFFYDNYDFDEENLKIYFATTVAYNLKTTSSKGYGNSCDSKSLDNPSASGDEDEPVASDESSPEIDDFAVSSHVIPKVLTKTVSISKDVASYSKTEKTDYPNSNDGLSRSVPKSTSKSIDLNNTNSTVVSEDKNATGSYHGDAENIDNFNMNNNIIMLLVALLLAIILIV